MTDVTKTEELNEAELDQVTGGVALLLPAVQSVREAGPPRKKDTTSAADTVPTENFSLNYEKIKF
ncbi:bacteriocin [Sphingorhabdus sp. Alg231-15]|uniref:bacteriocin n=1 Tax=Sphingorhabdus sp. Alg231-15 TaxID=1922222 RepID=UPI000D55C326